MQLRFQRSTIGLVAAIGLALCAGAPPAAAQGTAYKPPRTADGKPNMNGIWQALNYANWDLQDHASGPSVEVDCAAYCAEPGGPGVVDGGEIPYLPAAT